MTTREHQLGLFGDPPPIATETIEGSAVISPCNQYRYLLSRVWDARKPRLLWILLNPSVADAVVPDMTVTKGIGFSQRWGAGSMEYGNLFSYRATYTADLYSALRAGVDVVGPENDAYLSAAIARADAVIFAWGALDGSEPVQKRAAHVMSLLQRHDPVCLGHTKHGYPRHPSRIGYDTPIEAFNPHWPHFEKQPRLAPGRTGEFRGLHYHSCPVCHEHYVCWNHCVIEGDLSRGRMLFGATSDASVCGRCNPPKTPST